ncbi:hypothetical protein IWZ00DRAFT_534613 [Phyllosticta capitalensis]
MQRWWRGCWRMLHCSSMRVALQQLAAGVSASLAQIDITARRTQRFFEHTTRRVGDACASTFVSIKWDQIPKKGPCSVVFIVPALAYGPALGTFGFSAAGLGAESGIRFNNNGIHRICGTPGVVVGEGSRQGASPSLQVSSGSLAAGSQSAYSPVVAGGVFTTLQSAAMGGYGAGTIAALTQASAATAATAVGLSNIDSEKVDEDEKEE